MAKKKQPRRTGPPPVFWIVIAVVVVAAVIGIVVQSSRSKAANATVVTPKHALGPNDTEIEGDPSARVLVEEYGDFQCPSCRAFFDESDATIKQLVAAKKIRFAFGNFAFLGPESFRAASAALCAADAGKYWEYHDLLYTNQASENSGFLTTAPAHLVRQGRRDHRGRPHDVRIVCAQRCATRDSCAGRPRALPGTGVSPRHRQCS